MSDFLATGNTSGGVRYLLFSARKTVQAAQKQETLQGEQQRTLNTCFYESKAFAVCPQTAVSGNVISYTHPAPDMPSVKVNGSTTREADR